MKIVRNKKRTAAQVERILTALKARPMSAQEIADAIHLTKTGACKHLKALQAQKLIRIAGHRMQVRAREIPLFGLGSEPDAQYVKAKFLRVNVFDVQRAKVRKAILDELTKARATGPELAILTGMSEPSMRKYLPKMRAENLIHRAAWVERDGSKNLMAVWAAGNAPDAPKDKVLKMRIQTPLSEEQRDLVKMRKDVRKVIRAARKTPQNPFSALGL